MNFRVLARAPVTTLIKQTKVLPFTIAPARTAQDVADAVALRTAAYGNREGVDNLADSISKGDRFDAPERILLARCKQTGEALGSIRHHVVGVGETPLVSFPEGAIPHFESCLYLDRFAVKPGAAYADVGAMLIQASDQVQLRQEIRNVMFVSIRALTRYYRSIGFAIVPGYESGVLIPSLKDEPYYPMLAVMADWPQYLRTNRPALAAALFDFEYPDIRID
jgi:hypothetical protein